MPVYTLRRSSTSASSFKANMGISKYLKDIPVPCKEQINKLEQSVFKTLPNSKNGPKRKEEETSLLSEATLKATQYNTKWGKKSLWGMAAAAAKYMRNVWSCWSGWPQMRRCSRSDHSTRAYVAKCAKLLVEQVCLWSGWAKWRGYPPNLPYC